MVFPVDSTSTITWSCDTVRHKCILACWCNDHTDWLVQVFLSTCRLFPITLYGCALLSSISVNANHLSRLGWLPTYLLFLTASLLVKASVHTEPRVLYRLFLHLLIDSSCIDLENRQRLTQKLWSHEREQWWLSMSSASSAHRDPTTHIALDLLGNTI